MTILNRINREIAEINLQIARIQDRAREEIGELNRRKNALLAAVPVITPEVEAAFAALSALGIDLDRPEPNPKG